MFPMKINIVATDIVNDVTCSRKSVNTRVVITLLLRNVIHWKTATSYDKDNIDDDQRFEAYPLNIKNQYTLLIIN